MVAPNPGTVRAAPCDSEAPPVVATLFSPPPITPREALAASVTAFVTAFAAHRGCSFEEADCLLAGTPFNLWALTDMPQGWSALALLLSPPGSTGALLAPSIH